MVSEQQQGLLSVSNEIFAQLDQSVALLVAPTAQMKTSLLFQFAYSEASMGKRVLYMGSRKMQSFLKLFADGVTFDHKVLKSIEMKYLESSNALRSYFAHIHLLDRQSIPHLILIDDLLDISGSTNVQDLYKSLAFIKEASNYAETLQVAPSLPVQRPEIDLSTVALSPFGLVSTPFALPLNSGEQSSQPSNVNGPTNVSPERVEMRILLGSVDSPDAETHIEMYRHWIGLFFLLQGQTNPFRLLACDMRSSVNGVPVGLVAASLEFLEHQFKLIELETL